MGQRQWQYDVMSTEVNVANQMESYGLPGQVHISDSVRQQLDEEFELEKREKLEGDLIRDMDTYLVKAVLKEVSSCALDFATQSSSRLPEDASRVCSKPSVTVTSSIAVPQRHAG